MSDFNYAASVKRVTEREVAAARLANDYVALVAHFGLTDGSTADDITTAARTVVVDGARQAGTKTGDALTTDDLSGRDPGADASHRDYWRAARAVRIGLVRAIDKGESETPASAVLRVSLSGEGGGSSVVDMASDLGQSILAFLAAQSES